MVDYIMPFIKLTNFCIAFNGHDDWAVRLIIVLILVGLYLTVSNWFVSKRLSLGLMLEKNYADIEVAIIKNRIPVDDDLVGFLSSPKSVVENPNSADFFNIIRIVAEMEIKKDERSIKFQEKLPTLKEKRNRIYNELHPEVKTAYDALNKSMAKLVLLSAFGLGNMAKILLVFLLLAIAILVFVARDILAFIIRKIVTTVKDSISIQYTTGTGIHFLLEECPPSSPFYKVIVWLKRKRRIVLAISLDIKHTVLSIYHQFFRPNDDGGDMIHRMFYNS